MSLSPLSPYQAPRASTSDRSTLRNVLVVGATLLVAAALALGTFVLFAMRTEATTEKGVTPVVERYFADVAADDYHAAYESFGAALHAVTTEEQYASLERGVHARLGKLESKTVGQVQTGFGTGGSWAVVDYACRFEHGDASMRFRLEKRGGAWRIVGVHYDSPVLAQALSAASSSESR